MAAQIDSAAERYQTYRQSFRKTVVLALAAMLASAAIIIVGIVPFDSAPIAVFGGALLVASGIVCASGVLVLYRHRREQTGEPDLFWARLARLEDRPPRGLWRRVFAPRLRAGTLVRVRQPQEILATLDEHAETDGIPFMPEMWRCCGQQFPVHRVVDKINDWSGRTGTGLRRLKQFVTLRDIRCDGSAHGGCQADCHILWHARWLDTVADAAKPESSFAVDPIPDVVACNTLSRADEAPCYKCQITELVRASRKLKSWDIRQDLQPLLYGNVDLVGFLIAVLTRTFNGIQRLRQGMTYPMMPRQLERGPTPSRSLGLQPAEFVVALDKAAIGRTLYRNRNRGLWFGAETMRFCGQRYRVRQRVERFVDECTGEMTTPLNPFVTLETVMATGEFLRFCPQNEYVYWREIWLNRDD
ncbi:MAG TPA: hypothetical protein VE175_12985, partial [Woeseiaceae bacterium]|nr:hypothetical protein [Woeseiaceae bacterium]